MHLQRQRRHGDASVTKRPEMVIGTVAERFWPKVAKAGPSECWLFLGSKNKAGYGSLGMGGRGGGLKVSHRVAYELTHGPIPNGLVIDHLCKNPSCCNPNHLEAVTQKTNLDRGSGNQYIGATHCVNGHEFSEANTYIQRRPTRQGFQRVCRTCIREAQAKQRAKRIPFR